MIIKFPDPKLLEKISIILKYIPIFSYRGGGSFRESEEARRARENIFRQEEEKEKGKLFFPQKLAGSAVLHDGSSSNDWTGMGFTGRISAFSHQGDNYSSHNLKHGFKYITLPEMWSLNQMIDMPSWINCFVKFN